MLRGFRSVGTPAADSQEIFWRMHPHCRRFFHRRHASNVQPSQPPPSRRCYTSPMPNRLHRYYGAGYSHFITTSCSAAARLGLEQLPPLCLRRSGSSRGEGTAEAQLRIRKISSCRQQDTHASNPAKRGAADLVVVYAGARLGQSPTPALIVCIIQLRLPHSSRLSTSGHVGRRIIRLSMTPLHRWVTENEVSSAKPLIISSELPTILRQASRILGSHNEPQDSSAQPSDT